MLGNSEAIATIAVKKLDVARAFYEGKLELKPEPSGQPGVIGYKTGGTTILVYESEFAGSNKATAATWIAGRKVVEIARWLKGKGVVFEHYDFPGMKLEGDVHVGGNMRAAWFKDPDGNILALVGE